MRPGLTLAPSLACDPIRDAVPLRSDGDVRRLSSLGSASARTPSWRPRLGFLRCRFSASLLLRFFVLSSPIGEDDDGAVDGGAVEAGVGVPPERALFLGEDDAVGEGGAGLDEALRDVLRPVRPRVPRLFLAVPAR